MSTYRFIEVDVLWLLVVPSAARVVGNTCQSLPFVR